MSAPLREPLIFDYSRAGRGATAQWVAEEPAAPQLPEALRRAEAPALPEASELDVVRHYTRLSQLNFSIDTHFYPLGSCTMKYNPKACNSAALLPEFLGRHPLASSSSMVSTASATGARRRPAATRMAATCGRPVTRTTTSTRLPAGMCPAPST